MTVEDIQGYFFNAKMKDYFKKVKLHTLQFEINTACGQACKFCYVRQTVPPGTQLSKNFIFNVLKQANDLGVQTIEWLGGDPVRHPHFWEFVEKAREYGITNNIWSTGDLLTDPKIIDFLIDPDTQGMVSFHLDTLDPEIYQQVSSSSPDFISNTLSNIEEMLEKGVSAKRLYNCMTFTKKQAGKDFQETVKTLYEKYDIISGIVPYKHVVDIPELVSLIPSSQDIYEALKFRSNFIYGSKLPVTPQCVSKFYCGTTCSLTVNKELTPCTRIRHALTKVKGSDFLGAFENKKTQLLKEPLRSPDNLSNDCRNCEYNSICWGCRGNAWYYGGDILGVDPKCWHRKN
ncbi:MAG: radical SAM protein [Asgard group archaeon]|nr:radical SAM protein [Asgard group archaeon]